MDKKVILNKVDIIGKKYNIAVLSIIALVVLIIAFVFMYLFTIILSSWFLSVIRFNGNIINSIVCALFGASTISFIITYLIHLTIVKIFKNDFFSKWFKDVHLGLIYISGLFSAIYTVQPYLISENIITEGIGGNNTLWFLLFFIAITNYAIYDHIIISKGAAPKLKA